MFILLSSGARRTKLQVVHYRDDVHVLHTRPGVVVRRYVLRAKLGVLGVGDIHPVHSVLYLLVAS